MLDTATVYVEKNGGRRWMGRVPVTTREFTVLRVRSLVGSGYDIARYPSRIGYHFIATLREQMNTQAAE